jgi:hypothetical protein
MVEHISPYDLRLMMVKPRPGKGIIIPLFWRGKWFILL